MRIGARMLGLIGLVAAGCLYPGLLQARVITDSAGRTVTVPDRVARVFPAGPPASTLVYMLAPQTLIGWSRKPTEAEKQYMLPAVRDLPEAGRLTGRGDTINLEKLLVDRPDVIVDFGTLNDTYRSLADRIQQQSGIPYVLIDARFANTPAALRLMGDILGVKERGETLAAAAEALFAQVDATVKATPADRRPRVYLARGPEGLETGTRGSINTEIIERLGAVNVVEGLREAGGLITASPEQIIAWSPDTIVTIDRAFMRSLSQKPLWQAVPAVARKRVFLAPAWPFGAIDSPPSVNRLLGLVWLGHVFYNQPAEAGLGEQVKNFFRLFYHVDLSGPELAKLLDQSGN